MASGLRSWSRRSQWWSPTRRSWSCRVPSPVMGGVIWPSCCSGPSASSRSSVGGETAWDLRPPRICKRSVDGSKTLYARQRPTLPPFANNSSGRARRGTGCGRRGQGSSPVSKPGRTNWSASVTCAPARRRRERRREAGAGRCNQRSCGCTASLGPWEIRATCRPWCCAWQRSCSAPRRGCCSPARTGTSTASSTSSPRKVSSRTPGRA